MKRDNNPPKLEAEDYVLPAEILPEVVLPAATPELTKDKRKKWLPFVAGFLGWFLINGAIWQLFCTAGLNDPLINLFILPANIIALVVLGVIHRTRTIALGIVTAWAVNLLISLVSGVLNNGVCLIPFFSPLEWWFLNAVSRVSN